MKSPLRYPGGKFRYINKILPHIPPNSVLISPFLGGGHIELACAGRGQIVRASDAFFPLVNFWQWMIMKPKSVIKAVKALKECPKGLAWHFYEGKTIVQTQKNVEAAAYFFLINRCSFSGATLSGGFSQNASIKRFTDSSIERLSSVDMGKFSGVFCADFNDAFLMVTDNYKYQNPSYFIYADPPYYEVQGLYGNNGDMSFVTEDHYRLASALKKTQCKFALSYNDCPEIRALYDGCKFIELAPSKSMSNGKKTCPEILILN
jgi:DNA adenine methylase